MDSDEDDVGVDFQFAKGVELTSNECLRIFLSGKGSDKDLGTFHTPRRFVTKHGLPRPSLSPRTQG